MKTNILIVSMILTCGLVSAQTKTNLWPDGGIPGAVKNDNFPAEVVGEEGWITGTSLPELWSFPAPADKNCGAAVVICPGGGYSGVSIEKEGTKIAEWFNSLGISAYVLKYRMPNDGIMADKSVGPLQDVQEAIRTVRRNAATWKIDPNKIGVMGFSAGGHLASTASTHYNDVVYKSDATSARPDFSLLIYPVISMNTHFTHMGTHDNLIGRRANPDLEKRFSNELQITEDTPPAFLVHALDDRVVPVENSIRYIQALEKFGIKGELHIYQSGGHGFGLGFTDNSESTWNKACQKWLEMNGYL